MSTGVAVQSPRDINDGWGAEAEAKQLVAAIETSVHVGEKGVEYCILRDDEIVDAGLGGRNAPASTSPTCSAIPTGGAEGCRIKRQADLIGSPTVRPRP